MKDEMDSTKLAYDNNYSSNAYAATDMYHSNPHGYPPNPAYPASYAQPIPYASPMSYPQPYTSNNTPSHHYSQQAFVPVQPVVIIPASHLNVTEVHLSHKEHKTVKSARRAKIACIVNMVIDLLVLFYIPFLLVLIIFNLFGVFSTTKFNKCMAVTYIVYLYLLVILKVALIAMLPVPVIIGIFSVLIVMNLVVSGFFIAFVKRMGELDHSELDKCKMFYLANRKKCC